MAKSDSHTTNSRTALKSKNVWLQFTYATTLLILALGLALASSAARRLGNAPLSAILAIVALIVAVVICLTIVPRLARTVNAWSFLMPVSFRITRVGGIFLVLILVISMTALNIRNNLSFLVLAISLSAIIASGVFSRSTLRGLSVTLQIPDVVYAESAVLMRVTLRNFKKLLPSFSITVEGFRFAEKPEWSSWLKRFLHQLSQKKSIRSTAESLILSDHVYFPNIPAQKNIAISVVNRFSRRGRYYLDGFIVVTRFPFGFFRKVRRFQASGNLIVYPKPSEIRSYFHLLPFAAGQRENPYKGSGENLYSHRPYKLGDSVRSVDWKASAKTGDLMTKEYAKQDDRKVFICLDSRISYPHSAAWEAKFERAVEMAAGLSSHFIQEGAEVEFAIPEYVVPMQSGQQHLHRILEVLALVEPTWDSKDEEFSWPDIQSGENDGWVAPLMEKHYKILMTSKPRGSIPSVVWRTSRVEYFAHL